MKPVAIDCRRFWVCRGEPVDLSDDGYLVDPDSIRASFGFLSAMPFQAIAQMPALGRIGEPGMGKSTALFYEYDLAERSSSSNGDRFVWVDLGEAYSVAEFRQTVFESVAFTSWLRGSYRLHLFFDLDESILPIDYVSTMLVAQLAQVPRDRLSVRFACRTADWPVGLEAGLRNIWGEKVLVQILAVSEVASESGRGVIMQQPQPSRLPELSSAGRAAFRP